MARIMQFRQVFGGLSQPSPMIYAFFENGRRQAVIVRIYSGGDADHRRTRKLRAVKLLLGTLNSRVRSGISGSKSMTR